MLPPHRLIYTRRMQLIVSRCQEMHLDLQAVHLTAESVLTPTQSHADADREFSQSYEGDLLPFHEHYPCSPAKNTVNNLIHTYTHTSNRTQPNLS